MALCPCRVDKDANPAVDEGGEHGSDGDLPAIYQHATLDRDKALAERIGETYEAWRTSGKSK